MILWKRKLYIFFVLGFTGKRPKYEGWRVFVYVVCRPSGGPAPSVRGLYDARETDIFISSLFWGWAHRTKTESMNIKNNLTLGILKGHASLKRGPGAEPLGF